ncbi:copper-translocating P-type ATPase [Sphingorhabdus arenilitoris]|uniref:Copper-translocating P-type ATPase n=1 Tax=Sphingorhabdus arenilitoris TaxID=1490041 RepID=A0ABV8RES2_9SPHN
MPDMLGAFLELGFEAHPLSEAFGEQHNEDSRTLMKAMAVAGFAMMNIMLLSVSIWSGAAGITRDLFHWISALIALPTVVYSGRPFFRSSWTALRHRQTNMDVPITIGVFLATGLSLYETATGGAHAYFDGAVMLLFFLLVGRYLDSIMRDRARDGVTSLLKNMGTGAMVLRQDGSAHWTESTALKPAMIMLVAAGERFAADGKIIEGHSQIDKALLTGESKPETAEPGAAVFAGTLNVGSPVKVEITAAGADTALADIARLMGDAAQGKSRYVRIADRAARLYAPAVHSLALLSFAGWMLADAGWHHSLLIAVAVLIITCPCALGLAVPAAQIVASGSLLRRGVLVKDGSALERLSEIDRIYFDKTGTLTLGQPVLQNAEILDADATSIAIALARSSRHPLSKTMVATLDNGDIKAASVGQLSEIAGEGVCGQYGGQLVSLGRPTSAVDGDILAAQLNIGDDQYTLKFADALRPDAQQTIAQLKAQGFAPSILSGDRTAAVTSIANRLNITAKTQLRPEEKLAILNQQQSAGHRVLMVGDGLNDGPALAAGHASMAPASASDAGKNAADLVWMGDSLMPVIDAISMARRCQQIVRQNFALAIGYNIIAVPLAIMGFVTPLIAAIAMSGSSLIVVGNALRLKRTFR